ncbi:MAG: hypothetical protein ACD_62C00196G0001 [uncultured bacterium]|nr:MAG: hypothetical protein ACD_62C00196G0001 [uncultured bacterium]
MNCDDINIILIILFCIFVLPACSTGPQFAVSGHGIVNLNVLDGATDVPVDQTFTVVFSDTVMSESVNVNTFFIVSSQSSWPMVVSSIATPTVCDPDRAIESTISQNQTGQCVTSFTLTPSSPLSAGIEHTFCMTPDILFCDANENGLFSGLEIVFTTEATEVTPEGPETYSVGGTIDGLVGTVILENNGTDALSLTANGGFAFNLNLVTGEAYAVTVAATPDDVACVVTGGDDGHGAGVVDGANVTDVVVLCEESIAPVCDGVPDGDFQSGTGTEDDPYLLCTPEQLNRIGTHYLTSSFRLAADIDMTGSDFTMIGNGRDQAFLGTFDGNHHTISNIILNLPDETYVGFISVLSGTVQNLGLTDIDIGGELIIGGLAGYTSADSTIDGSYATGVVTPTLGTAGGLVGINCGTITNAYAIVDVICEDCPLLGGLAGGNGADCDQSSIIDSYAKGDVTGTSLVGGLVGKSLVGTTITSSYASDNNVSGKDMVGGLVGQNDGTVSESHSSNAVTVAGDAGLGPCGGFVAENTGNITSSSSDSVVNSAGWWLGQFVGDNNGNIEHSQALGSVTATVGTLFVGGLVGSNWGLVYDSFASADVNAPDSIDVGCLVGWNATGNILSVQAECDVTGGMAVGGLVGGNESTIAYTYAQSAVEGGEHVGGLVGSNVLGSINDSFADSVTNATRNVGGLVGTNQATIENTYAVGPVTGDDNVGGLVGAFNDDGTCTASFWDTETSLVAADTCVDAAKCGSGKTDADMKLLGTFSPPWDFDDVWEFVDGGDYDYPSLRLPQPL